MCDLEPFSAIRSQMVLDSSDYLQVYNPKMLSYFMSKDLFFMQGNINVKYSG